ncbi:glycoside hydrolase family 99-like domain-containing protein [Fusobacterium varium]|nr:glycoside hydrolase family 99-like domain-containing protein [Fusobacterium varium]
MKIITFYLPQFHSFPENDVWWGKDFTEWTNTKKSQSLFKGHYQPREPENNNYYNLLDNKVIEWQIKLAKEHGIYGFCFYHYWFKNGKKLMEKPIENYLKDKSLNQKFCLCWANENWTRTWDGKDREVIMKQEYGEKKEWEEHFYYLLDFFKDDRYILKDKKPIFLIYKPMEIKKIAEMIEYWQYLAKLNGLAGICFIAQNDYKEINKVKKNIFDYGIMFEPGYTQNLYSINTLKKVSELFEKVKVSFFNQKIFFKVNFQKSKKLLKKFLNINNNRWRVTILDYDIFWKDILNRKSEPKIFFSAFTDWDNSPRRGINNSRIFIGSNPEKFKVYMKKLIEKEKKNNKEIIFINAWNEWAEGAYLEPDKKYGKKYLQALRQALLETKELKVSLKERKI